MVYIGTKKPLETKKWQSSLMSIKKLKATEKEIATYFKNPNIYFIASSKGCSCEFRIAMERELGFDIPKDWYPESKDQIDGTKLIYQLIKETLKHAEKIELLSIWNDHIGNKITKEHISLKEVPENKFRMFEDMMFICRNLIL